ncbi:subunit of tubulin prefoldin, partial [Ascosphaera acerosa]
FRGCIQSIADGVEKSGATTTAAAAAASTSTSTKTGQEGAGDDADSSNQILIPLTESLYVKGRVADRERVMVDVGTGYYVEKTTAQARAFYEAKVKEVGESIAQLDKVLQVKTVNERAVQEVLRQKILSEGPAAA